MTSSTLVTDYLGEGTHAARPAAPPIPTGGLAFYYETDTTQLFFFNKAASTWVAVAGGSGGAGVFFGLGAPSTLQSEGALYFDTSATPYNLYVQHTGAWHAAGGGTSSGGNLPFNPPLAASFTTTIGSPVSITDVANLGAVIDPGLPAGSVAVNGFAMSVPATPWVLTARFRTELSAVNFSNAGIVLSDGSGKLITWANANGIQVKFDHWTNSTTFSSEPFANSYSYSEMLRISDDGTNITAWVSQDGVNFIALFTESRTAFFAAGPTKAGFFYNGQFTPVGSVHPKIACLYWSF